MRLLGFIKKWNSLNQEIQNQSFILFITAFTFYNNLFLSIYFLMPTNQITLNKTYFDGFSLRWDAIGDAVRYHVKLTGKGPWATTNYDYSTTDTFIDARLVDWENQFSIALYYEVANGTIVQMGDTSACRTLTDHGDVVILDEHIDYLKHWLDFSEEQSFDDVVLSTEGCATVRLGAFASGVVKYAVVMSISGSEYNVIPYNKTNDAFLAVHFPLLSGQTVSFKVIPFKHG